MPDHPTPSSRILRLSVTASHARQNTLVNNVFTLYANEEIRSRAFPRLAKTAIGSFCLSEASSGSDAFALKTRADKKGDYYVINGSKVRCLFMYGVVVGKWGERVECDSRCVSASPPSLRAVVDYQRRGGGALPGEYGVVHPSRGRWLGCGCTAHDP